jgi:2-desacetyl-2-hydroxyethyl bacteriochlorophyllide A dehydrogenase
MRAVVAREGVLYVEERPDPTPGPGEVIASVLACGICGSDLHYLAHCRHTVELARSLGAPTAELERAIAQGVVLGHEFVARIEGFGPGTQRALRAGDRVCSMPFVTRAGSAVLLGSNPETSGAFAERIVLTESSLLRVDDALPDEAAAWVEPLAIAVHAVARAELRPDDRAVVIGCGPIGLATIAALRARGMRQIVASDLSAKRRELAGSSGAEHVVDPLSASPLGLAAIRGARRLVVFENTGASGMLDRLVLEAPAGARIVVAGIAAGYERFLPMLAISKELSFVFAIYYEPAEFARAHELLRRGALDWNAWVTGRVGLPGVAQAFRELADPERHAKIVIDPRL